MVTYDASASDAIAGSITPSCSPASGATFGIGETTVNCTANDGHGNSAAGSFKVTVTLVDTTAPVVTAPANRTVQATSSAGATQTFSASATDNVDGPLTPSCTPGSGSVFPFGTTTVTCTATDAHHNTGSDSFTITVHDTVKPTVSAPADTTVEATSSAGATASFSATANDNVDGALSASCSPSSGSTFAIGTTTVTCSASDSHGNSGSDSFTITVRDTTRPTLSLPSDISRTASTAAGVAVTYSASATDTVAGSIPPSCSPASGATFGIGETTVNCTASDGHGNSAAGSFKVTVTLVDTSPPVVQAPADRTVEATSPGGATETFSATANDNIDGSLTPSCAPASGSVFPFGVTTVTCSATDAHHNTGTDSFKITVRDTVKPTVTVPADMTVEATSTAGAPVSFSAGASDNVDGSIAAVCTPSSGSTFAVGATTVTCTASDSHGNSGTASFKVTVHDTGSPVLTPPATTVVEATNAAGAAVTFTVSATDLVDGPIAPPSITCTPATGSTFPVGTTDVQCSAVDNAGNRGTATFKIVVKDTTPPRLNVPAAIQLTTSGGGPLPRTDPTIAAFLASARATDLVDPAVAVTNDAPESFNPETVTKITFTATDKSGNKVSATSTVSVVVRVVPPPPPPDTSPPPDPSQVKASPGNRQVVVSWQKSAAADLDHYSIEQSSDGSPNQVVVYTGSGTTYTATGLTNGAAYRFVVAAVDHAGNTSTGAVVTATPHAPPLVRPAEGAVLAAIPTLVWQSVAGAVYYNVQLYRMPSLAAVGGRKVLSAWPTTTSLQLARAWKYNGIAYQLSPGLYRWFVWPGVGPRANGKYGALLGSSMFVVKKLPAPAKKPKAKPPPPRRRPLRSIASSVHIAGRCPVTSRPDLGKAP